MLNPRSDIFKIERIFWIDASRVAHRNAYLADSTQALANQRQVSRVEGLIPADEQGRRLLVVEHRTDELAHLFGPIFGRTLGWEISRL
jgi:hypothetical protein